MNKRRARSTISLIVKSSRFAFIPVQEGDGNPDFVSDFNRLTDHYASSLQITW